MDNFKKKEEKKILDELERMKMNKEESIKKDINKMEQEMIKERTNLFDKKFKEMEESKIKELEKKKPIYTNKEKNPVNDKSNVHSDDIRKNKSKLNFKYNIFPFLL